MDGPGASGGSSSSQRQAEATRSLETAEGVEEWQRTSTFPFKHIQIASPPSPESLSTEEYRLLYYVCVISRDLEATDSAKPTTWAREIPEYVATSSALNIHHVPDAIAEMETDL